MVVACGAGEERVGRPPDVPPSAPGALLVKPCDLVTRAEAERFLGTPLDEGQTTSQPAVGQSACVYHETGQGGGGAMAQVAVSQTAAMPPGRLVSPEGLFRDIRRGGFPDAPRVEGVGDDAFLAPPGVHVLHRGYYLTLSVGLLRQDRERVLRELAATATANLDRLLGNR